jgi:DNA polymerase I-like protein with 3'-5' exonuclease and polymerase domains
MGWDYLTFDLETSYGKKYGRVGNRWDEDFGLCSIGALTGKGEYISYYTVSMKEHRREGSRDFGKLPFPDLTNIVLLVGHNIKFDLLWYWDHPQIIEFLKRGGKIWDTMYAEYLLSGQLYNMNGTPGYQINLKACATRRKLEVTKQDIVKALWESGMRTEDISEGVLMEYMKYDILTTDALFKAQIKQARRQGQVRMIQNSMDGLLATTEMEFNGMYINLLLAMEQKAQLEIELAVLKIDLDEAVPELPEGCEFKWGSWRHLSALLFGGEIKYVGREYSLDADGRKQYYQKKVKVYVRDENNEIVHYKSGKRAGECKSKYITVPDTDKGAKQRNCELAYTLPQITRPSSRWAAESAGEYPDGTPRYYSTNKKVIDKLKSRGVTIVDTLLNYRKKDKDLGTYYIRTKGEKSTGMLTNIQPADGCVHGHLNHAVTVTRRLSGSQPNLQNLNKKGDIKKTFESRFPKGVVAELDYSQLEVITQGVNSGDTALLKALNDGICFHCEWLAFAEGMGYEEVFDKAKVQKLPVWIKKREKIKPVNFGEAYGAGIPTLSEESGLDADTIKKAIEGRMAAYPQLYAFHEIVMEHVQQSRAITNMRTDKGYQRGVGYFRSDTTTVYHFLESETPDWQQQKGIMTAFSPTIVKNYPSQGLGGEIMQTMMGLVYRMLRRHDLTNDVKLMLTVHDSIYLDFRTEFLAKTYLPLIAAVLEDVTWFFNACFEDVMWATPFPVDADYGQNIKECTESVPERDLTWVNIIREEFK